MTIPKDGDEKKTFIVADSAVCGSASTGIPPRAKEDAMIGPGLGLITCRRAVPGSDVKTSGEDPEFDRTHRTLNETPHGALPDATIIPDPHRPASACTE